jgi:nitrite reductase (NO-forming)
MHVANGMFGMILVEPPGGLPKVDREFYIMQSEIYTSLPLGQQGLAKFSNDKLMAEQPTYYVFNGRVGALNGSGALHVKTGEKVRIYFGVGTFKSSAFHVIGGIFDDVYTDGGVGGAIEHNVGVVNVPPGGTTIADLAFKVPGTYVIVDHALQRVIEGASGQIVVDGTAAPGVFVGDGGGAMTH